jgi:hypothetical protein
MKKFIQKIVQNLHSQKIHQVLTEIQIRFHSFLFGNCGAKKYGEEINT